MQSIKIEKRLPFGFMGDWGKVYKQYNFDEKTDGGLIKYQDSFYIELGQDVQFKYLGDGIDNQSKPSQPLENRVAKGEFRTVETTDAYFDIDREEYECVVEVGDIINLSGCWWVVDSIDGKSIFTPQKQTFYYLSLKRIKEEISKL
ncbi:MAG: hypothetical protein K2K60_03050 [Clostridia bacterium]|nr:hypothetical protein [Clostridia bacterium]